MREKQQVKPYNRSQQGPEMLNLATLQLLHLTQFCSLVTDKIRTMRYEFILVMLWA